MPVACPDPGSGSRPPLVCVERQLTCGAFLSFKRKIINRLKSLKIIRFVHTLKLFDFLVLVLIISWIALSRLAAAWVVTIELGQFR